MSIDLIKAYLRSDMSCLGAELQHYKLQRKLYLSSFKKSLAPKMPHKLSSENNILSLERKMLYKIQDSAKEVRYLGGIFLV